MPRGDHLRQHTDDEILEAFQSPEIQNMERNAYLPRELAQNLDIGAEAVRKRLHKMEGERVKTVEISGVTLWAERDAEIWADGQAPQLDQFKFENIARAVQTTKRVGRVGWGLVGATLLLFLDGVLLSGNLLGPLYLPVALALGWVIWLAAVAFQLRHNPEIQGRFMKMYDSVRWR